MRRQAQLRFRLVACVEGAQDPCATGSLPMGRAPLALDGEETDGPNEEPSESDTSDPAESESREEDGVRGDPVALGEHKEVAGDDLPARDASPAAVAHHEGSGAREVPESI